MSAMSKEAEEFVILSEVAEMDRASQERFAELVRKNDGNLRAALMFLTRRAPGSPSCDREFNRKARERMNATPWKYMRSIVKIAQNAGIDTNNKFYCGGLGKYNDPDAWVSTNDDVLRVARKKNLKVRGTVNYTPGSPRTRRFKLIAEDILQDKIRRSCEADPALAEKVAKSPKALAELREKLIEKHAGRRSKDAVAEQAKDIAARTKRKRQLLSVPK